MQKTILLHDVMLRRGGAETLALLLCRDMGIPLVYASRDESLWPVREISDIKLIDLRVRARLTGLGTFRRQRAFARHTQFLADYDIVIYGGCDAMCAVGNHHQGLNVYYCHAPPRQYYEQYQQFEDDDFASLGIPHWCQPLMRRIRGALIKVLRLRYETAIRKMHIVIANSENVRRRLKAFLDIDATVIHPPCDTKAFVWRGQKDYYLSTARHESLKRVELIIDAFRQMPEQRLVITSTGSLAQALIRRAAGADNIHFTGLVNNAGLYDLIGWCIATIYVPVDEDFGISPVESMAAGKPVIGAREGGLLETVVDGETGLLIGPDPQPEDIVAAVARLDRNAASTMRDACEQRAKLFTRDVFSNRLRALLKPEAGRKLGSVPN